jgi:hypothetical protein
MATESSTEKVIEVPQNGGGIATVWSSEASPATISTTDIPAGATVVFTPAPESPKAGSK